MRRKIITPTGGADITAIYDYLNERAPYAAAAFSNLAISTFENYPDEIWTPPRASDDLPEHVRVLHLGSPFRGYTMRIAIYDDAVFLLAAFAPGLPEDYKDSRTLTGLRSVG